MFNRRSKSVPVNLIEDEYSDPAEMLGASGSSVAFALLYLPD